MDLHVFPILIPTPDDFFIKFYYANIFLLVLIFNPLYFNVITNKIEFKSAILFLSLLFCPSNITFIQVKWVFFSIQFYFLFVPLTIYFAAIFLVVILGIKSNHLVYKNLVTTKLIKISYKNFVSIQCTFFPLLYVHIQIAFYVLFTANTDLQWLFMQFYCKLVLKENAQRYIYIF